MTVDFSQTYRVYRINLKWNLPFDTKVAVPPGSHLIPALNLMRVQVISPQRPLGTSLSQGRVCHLLLLPAMSEAAPHPTIVAVYTGVLGEATAGISDGGPRASHIARWELQDGQRALHPIFHQLKLNREVTSRAEPEVSL